MAGRWRVAVLVCAAIAISYLDRLSLPVAVTAIQRDIPLTNTQFGDLTSLLLLAYALMYEGGGARVDRLGMGRGFPPSWCSSVACASHALAAGVVMLALSRFLLGLGEGGASPRRRKSSRWFPVAERSTAMGIVSTGTAVGAVVAPPALPDPAARELALGFRRVRQAPDSSGPRGGESRIAPGRSPLSHRRMRAPFAGHRCSRSAKQRELVAAGFLTDAAWFFYISWLPKYLYDARHFDVKRSARTRLPCTASGSVPARRLAVERAHPRGRSSTSRASARSGSAPPSCRRSCSSLAFRSIGRSRSSSLAFFGQQS